MSKKKLAKHWLVIACMLWAIILVLLAVSLTQGPEPVPSAPGPPISERNSVEDNVQA